MKFFKRIISIAIVGILILAASVVGAAAEGNPLPDQTRNGNSSITIHKYGIYMSYKTTYEADGKIIENPNTVIGTIDDGAGGTTNITLNDLNPLKNIEFKIERMVEKKNTEGNIIYEIDTTYTEIIKSTDINGMIIFDDLEFGIYKITELPNAAVTQVLSSPIDVSVPMSDPTNLSEWIYDIHLYPKNQIDKPDIDKSISYPENQFNTADLNEQVKWIITSQIPTDIATSKEYIITDNLHEILKYAESPNALEVSYINALKQKVILSEGSDYTLTYMQGSPGYPWNDSLTITLTEIGRKNVANALSSDHSAPLPRLTVEFYTKFEIPNEYIMQYLGVSIENQAKLEYTNSANVTYTPKSEKPEVHIGGVRLKKINTKNEILGGAEFKIYRTEEDALAGQNAITDPFDLSDQPKEWVATSNPTTGLAEFLGLAYGAKADASSEGYAYNDSNAETIYWIVEVTAPRDADGKSYNLLKEPLQVVVNATSHDDTNIINVVNSKFILPITGGAGTLMFTVCGAVLLGIGIFILLISKKKRKTRK